MNFTDNSLVSSLTKADQAALHSGCRATELKSRHVLAGPDAREAAYFFAGASVAKMVQSGRCRSVAVGLIGPYGTVGLNLAFGAEPAYFSMLVQRSGAAWVIEGAALRKMVAARPPMMHAISRHLCAENQELAQYAVRLRTRTVSQRLAHWIVASQGVDKASALDLTHEYLAQVLGVRRVSITVAAALLREAGFIDYSRGQVLVRDQKRLEKYSSSQR